VKSLIILVKADSMTSAMQAEVLARLKVAVPSAFILSPKHLVDTMARHTAANRIYLWLALPMTLIAIGLVLVGCYTSVKRRITGSLREIAIRLALGGSVSRVQWETIRPIILIAGTAVLTALAISSNLNSLALHVMIGGTLAPSILVFSSIVAVICLTLGAAYLATRTISQIDPAEILRRLE
jgi:hypothetical protein